MPSAPRAELVRAARRLARDCAKLDFRSPVRYVYNPLLYARRGHEEYLRRFGATAKRVVFLGMNPGPWGMAQTGVPFGEVAAVRDWMGIVAPVARPQTEHPRVRVRGLDCGRSEVSGARLWGLMRNRFGSAAGFFHSHFVANYCPLLFLDASGRNITPDKLDRRDREALLPVCDRHVSTVVEVLEPSWLVGIGRFAEDRFNALRRVLGWKNIRILGIPHPSPANPLANRDWAGKATAILCEAGLW
jgi:single-strand selective monofunctional uracil DNA glycosylase